MAAPNGIRSVDFIITATGEGVVNANGSSPVFNPGAGKTVKNHQFPKLRGVDPTRRLVKATLGSAEEADAADQQRLFSLGDQSLESARLVVSPETLRHHVFKTASFGLVSVTPDNIREVLPSLHGLIRGYLMTGDKLSIARRSPLMLTALECEKPGLYFNQGSRSFSKDENSLFSYFGTAKDLKYVGLGSISIEGLRFIPLENTLMRSAFMHTVTASEGHELADSVTTFLRELSDDDAPKADFVEYVVRQGGLKNAVGEAGLLLNDAAIDVLINETIEMLRNLYIRQGKGYVRVTKLQVDFNDSPRVLRIQEDEGSISEVHAPDVKYMQYYSPVKSTKPLVERMAALKQAADAAAKTKGDRKAAQAARKAAKEAATKAATGGDAAATEAAT
jgi:hypothetical protein